MSFLEKILKLVLCDFATYPSVDLRQEIVLENQYTNIKKFRVKRNRLYLAFILLCAQIALIKILSILFDLNTKEGFFININLAIVAVLMLLLLIFVLGFKCPNCGTIPKGRYGSVGSEVSYSKGMHPFPKRCECCGYYLSEKALWKDLQRGKA